MMKNKMMRVASVLLVAVLLSTCAISGTFAKYVTSASGSDSARVAKWGIVMDNTGKATFKDTYSSKTATGDTIVKSGVDVVAPGTSGSSTYTITGTPETDYKITFSYNTAAGELKDVFLGAGTYTYDNVTEGNGTYVNASTTVSTPYYPIKYKIVITTKLGEVTLDATKIAEYTKTASVAQGQEDTYTLADITSLENAMKQLKATTIAFDNNEACDVVVTLSWDWAFEQGQDHYDTILGELALESGSDLTASQGASYSTEVKYTLIMTATQTNGETATEAPTQEPT